MKALITTLVCAGLVLIFATLFFVAKQRALRGTVFWHLVGWACLVAGFFLAMGRLYYTPL